MGRQAGLRIIEDPFEGERAIPLVKVRRPGKVEPLFPEQSGERECLPDLDAEPTRAFVLQDVERAAEVARTGGDCPPRSRTIVARPAPELKVLHEPESRMAMQFRLLRFRLESDGARVVAVTGARAGDGASVTAFNMALALAEGSRRTVVLCDLDLRSGGTTSLAGLDGVRGLTELLAQRRSAGLGAIPLVPVTRGLSVLPRGVPSPIGTALLGSPELFEVIEELGRAFDVVVLDVAPVLDHADATMVQGVTDRFVLCVRSATRAETVKGALARLPARKVMGTVLVGAP